MRGGVQVQARICPMARRCSYELEKCGGACTGQDGLSAPDAKADKSGLVDHVLLRARKLPLARHDNVSTTLRVRHHIALAPLRMCAVAFPHTAGNWVLESSERDAGPYPLGRARPLFASIYGYATFKDWTVLAPSVAQRLSTSLARTQPIIRFRKN